MRRFLPLLPLFALLLSGCYETRIPVVAEGVRPDGIRDGRWRRADGSELELSWAAAEGAFRVGAGGKVRLAPLGRLWLADYQAERNVVLLARLAPDGVVLLEPTPETEKRLAAVHGLGVRPGPINRLAGGDGAAVRGFLADLAALDGTGQLREADRLVWVGPL